MVIACFSGLKNVNDHSFRTLQYVGYDWLEPIGTEEEGKISAEWCFHTPAGNYSTSGIIMCFIIMAQSTQTQAMRTYITSPAHRFPPLYRLRPGVVIVSLEGTGVEDNPSWPWCYE